jgi:hypothetical protein
MTGANKNEIKEKLILLGLMPFWEPQIPPMGISCLKTFLESHGYHVKTVDANIKEEFSQAHQKYFNTLQGFIPSDRQGNFNNVGHDVLRNHMMAHIHYNNEKDYIELVKILVYKTFYTGINHAQVRQLNEILEEFYDTLEKYITGLLYEERPGILGLSVYRGNLAPSMFAFRLAREFDPQVKTVMGGGVFAGELNIGSVDFDFFLKKTPYIDKIIVGEGELLFLKYLHNELPGSQRVYTLNDISGRTLDITAAKAPDFSDLDLLFYPNLAAYTSRSCPFQCSFCSETVYWGKYRKKGISQIIKELTTLYNKHKSQLILMCDSLLNPVVTDLARGLIDSGLSLYWDGYLRVEEKACQEENTMLWRRGGFYRARLGIESGSPHVLELMGKNIPVKHIKASISNLASTGIKTTTYWVIGHPGETGADFQQTLDIIAELRDDIYEAWCSPFNYYLSGQVNSGQWKGKGRLLYPEKAKDMLIIQTRVLDGEPTREDAYQRMNRFVRHCNQLGIPNPYTMLEFYHADERWKKLHKNAVPSLVEFENKDTYIDENKRVRKTVTAQKKLSEDITFDF